MTKNHISAKILSKGEFMKNWVEALRQLRDQQNGIISPKMDTQTDKEKEDEIKPPSKKEIQNWNYGYCFSQGINRDKVE